MSPPRWPIWRSAPPVNGTVEVAGPEKIPLDKLARQFLAAKGDKRQVIADVHARYFGTELNDQSLTPGENPRLGATRFETGSATDPSANRPFGPVTA